MAMLCENTAGQTHVCAYIDRFWGEDLENSWGYTVVCKLQIHYQSEKDASPFCTRAEPEGKTAAVYAHASEQAL